MNEPLKPNTPQNLVYLKECPSCRSIAKGYGGISQGIATKSNRLIVSYTCSGYNSDWDGTLNINSTRYGIKFDMMRDSINRLAVIAIINNKNWDLVVTPTITDDMAWDIGDDTRDYFYVYRAFLSSIIEFISVLRTQSQMFNEYERILFKDKDNGTLNWKLFENIFRSLKMTDYRNKLNERTLVYRM